MPTARPDLDLPALLGSLADVMLDSQPWDGPARATFVALAPDDRGLDIGFKELDGHPADTLLGFVAPDDWLATGVSCSGWAARYDEPDFERSMATGSNPSVRPSAHPQRRRVRQACIVSRLGEATSRIHVDGEEPADAGEPSGLLIDCLRRSLDLPTTPSSTSADQTMAVAWCERVAALHGVGDGVRGMWSWGALEVVAPPPIRAGVTWGDLRWAAVSGLLPVEGLDSAVAAWMDDAMFARWVMPGVPPLAVVSAAAAAVFTPAGRHRFYAALEAASDPAGPGR